MGGFRVAVQLVGGVEKQYFIPVNDADGDNGLLDDDANIERLEHLVGGQVTDYWWSHASGTGDQVLDSEIFNANTSTITVGQGFELPTSIMSANSSWSVSLNLELTTLSNGYVFSPYAKGINGADRASGCFRIIGPTAFILTENTADVQENSTGTLTFQTDVEYNITLVHEANINTIKLYVDDVLDVTHVYTGTLAPIDSVYTGARNYDDVNPPYDSIDGSLWAFSYWSRALTSEEITERYNNGTTQCLGLYSSGLQVGITSWYPFYNHDGFIGQEVIDQSGTSPSAINVGSIPFTGSAQIECEKRDTSGDIIFTVDTTQAGSASDTFVFPMTVVPDNPMTIKWGDGNSDIVDTLAQPELTHAYSSGGIYQITIMGADGMEWAFNQTGDKSKIISIEQWGVTKIVSAILYQCNNLNSITATDSPECVSLRNAVRDCFSLTIINNIQNWDVSLVEDFAVMARQCPAEFPIGSWDMGSATDCAIMLDLSGCTTANLDDIYNQWSAQLLQSNVSFGANPIQYSSASAVARQKLIDDFNWTITDGGLQP